MQFLNVKKVKSLFFFAQFNFICILIYTKKNGLKLCIRNKKKTCLMLVEDNLF